MNDSINIAIAEDHRLVRQGFTRMLSDYSNINVLFEAGNGKELLKNLKEHKPSIILLDIAMPVLGGLKAMEKIKQRYPKIKIVVISSFCEETSIVEYVKRGADSFLNKNCDVEQLLAAIYGLNEGGTYFDEPTTKLLVKHGLMPGHTKRELTDKELDILKLICSEKTHKEIAGTMNIKEITVDWYKHKLLQKTNCKDLSELISYAKKKHSL